MNRDYEEWHESKDELPPIGEVVEGINPKKWLYSELGRDYFTLVCVNNELIWITPGLNNYEYKELKIKYWRFIPPEPNGKNPFVKVKNVRGYWTPKVYFERIGF